MNILFLIYHGFSRSSGISKKIHYQINGLKMLGHKVYLCYFEIEDNGVKVRKIDNRIIQKFGSGLLASIKSKCYFSSILHFAKTNDIDLIYARSFHNANPFTIHLFKQFKKNKIKSVIELPTYPYDQEYVGFSKRERFELKIDQLFRYKLAKSVDKIITFTNEKIIFGQNTIQISNGIEFESIPVKSIKINNPTNTFHFIAVAEVHYWHGYDRFIEGIGEYYKNKGNNEVFFHIVGDIAESEMYNSIHAKGFYELLLKYDIKKRIIFHGPKYGKELDELFEMSDLAIGSLARHRCGINSIKTLKNREYAARGIPFIYSEIDSDFDYMPFILRVPADESPIDIQHVINFKKEIKLTPMQIRESIKNLSWKEQMGKVVKGLNYNDI